VISKPKQRSPATLENRIDKYLGIFVECPHIKKLQGFNKAEQTDRSHEYIVK